MLTVAYVGNFTRAWCTEVHVAKSLEALGHRVLRWQEDAVDWRSVPADVRAHRADLLLWTRTWEVDRASSLAALGQLAADGVPTVAFHLDRWFGLAREYQIETEPFFRCSLVVTADGDHDDDWRRAGVNHAWMPPGVYERECEPVPPNPRLFPHQVVFVGTVPYPHPEWNAYRQGLLRAMRRAFGTRFAVYPRQRYRPVRGRQLGALYATARVVLGDSCLAGGADAYWSDRVPETLGRGGILVHPRTPTLAEWYPELPTYEVGDYHGAVDSVRRLLRLDVNERSSLAERNRQAVLNRDTYRHRMQTVLDLALKAAA